MLATNGFSTEPPPRSQHTAKFSHRKSYEDGDLNFSNCHTTSCWSRNQRVM